MTDPFPPEALLADAPEPIRGIAERLRVIVRRAVPDAIERVRPGWRVIGYDVPVGRRTAYFAWIMAQPEHAHLGFPRGDLMDDPDRRLSGTDVTLRARWITLQPGDRISAAALASLVREAARVARQPRSTLLATILDREGPPVDD